MLQSSYGRRTVVGCTLFATGFVVVGTLVPFSFDRSPGGPADWYGLLSMGWPGSSTSDVITNIVVYLPIGALSALLLARFRRPGLIAVICACAMGAVMSMSLEWLQTMMSARVASWVDVCMNALGALLGAIAAALSATIMPPLRLRFLGALRERPYSTVTVALVIGLMLYHLIPFDFVTSTSGLRRSLAQTALWPLVGGPSRAGDSWHQWLQWFGYAGQFALLGLLSVLAYRERGLPLAYSLRKSIACIMLVPLAIEVSQVFVVSHAFDAADWLAASGGGLVGLGMGGWMVTRRPTFSVGHVLGVLLVGQVVYLLATSAAPFDLSWQHVDPSRLLRLPFAAAVSRPLAPAAADLLGTAVTFSIMAVVVRTLLNGTGHRRRVLVVMVLVFAVAAFCQFLQLLTASRHPDMTDPLIALGVALPIATWRTASTVVTHLPAASNPPQALPTG